MPLEQRVNLGGGGEVQSLGYLVRAGIASRYFSIASPPILSPATGYLGPPFSVEPDVKRWKQKPGQRSGERDAADHDGCQRPLDGGADPGGHQERNQGENADKGAQYLGPKPFGRSANGGFARRVPCAPTGR